MTAHPPALPHSPPATLEHELQDLYLRGTPANTLRAYERDLVYIRAWRKARFDGDLAWPEAEEVALRFVLDHARDLSEAAMDDPVRQATEALIAAGLRRALSPPAPSTLDRRIASWRAFHRMRNLASPFDAPLLRQARAKARRALARPVVKKSANPVMRDVLEALMAACGPDADGSPLRGLRDRAILAVAWASGGRRRAEIAGLSRKDVDLGDFDVKGLIWLRLFSTKTTGAEATPTLVVKGRAARALVAWIDAAHIEDGPLFRPISKAGRVLRRPLSADGIRLVMRRRLEATGLDPNFASPHGLRSGFLTQAALDGVPVQAAMRLSLHRSVAQAQRYYDDVEITVNPATDLLD
ncbi:MAG: tyrosine-type recombinase/integrase [Pseudomonadota bacterium]